MALITIVDKDNNVIGRKSRKDITHEDIYRACSLWIRNSKGEILLAQRSHSKDKDPGKWGPAVGGTVEYDQSYLNSVIKETQEELGISINESMIQKGPLRFNNLTWKYFAQSYIYTCDLDIHEFIIQDVEVSAIKWFSQQEIDDMLSYQKELMIESFPHSWELIKPFLNSSFLVQ